MARIKVKLEKRKDDSYTIHVKTGLFAEMGKRIASLKGGVVHWTIVSDSNVAALYGAQLARTIKRAGLKVDMVVFPAGERSKSRATLNRIHDRLFELGLGRDGGLAALGGGVTGDLAGFAAATFMRGIPHIQVPTTLLAMADSSVGGKTGVNVKAGKNMVGAFHQPAAVFIDPELLNSLPDSQMISGMAEIVKHAVVADAELFAYLEKNGSRFLNRKPSALERVIAANCSIKARVVEADERESGRRQILNYGHTVGHGLELLSKYRLSHGKAVAAGMAVEGKIAAFLELLPGKDLRRQNDLLEHLGFDLSLAPKYRPNDLLAAMRSDKKARAAQIRMALPKRLGAMARSAKGKWTIPTPERVIKKALKNRK